MAIVPTPLKRALSIARMSGLNATGWTAADWLDNMGLNVPEAGHHTPTPPGVRAETEAFAEPAAVPEVDPFTVTPEEQATFRRIATSGERHEWLERAAEFLRPVIKAAGGELPDNVRVSISWPFATRKAIGQCWHAEASKDSVREVFVSPTLDESTRVLGVLAHELCHACLPPEVKHGPKFAKLAKGIGLEGKMTATTEGPRFLEAVAPFVAQWGEYPAKGLDVSTLPRKVQTTRLLKVECEECGYVARVARAWLERAGTPICPVDEVPMVCEAL